MYRDTVSIVRPTIRKFSALLCLSLATYLSVHLVISEATSGAAYDKSVATARPTTRAAWGGRLSPAPAPSTLDQRFGHTS
jgi:hypothetical protein